MFDLCNFEVSYFNRRENTGFWQLNDQELKAYGFAFILSGQIDYLIDHQEISAKAGELVFFRPGNQRIARAGDFSLIAVDFTTNQNSIIDFPQLSKFTLSEQLAHLFDRLEYYWLNLDYLKQARCQAVFLEILIELAEGNNKNRPEEKIEQVKRYVVTHSQNKLALAELAQLVNLNPAYLSSLFKKNEGQSLSNYIQKIRINKALPLLEEGFLSISQIAEQTGFSDLYYFSKTFKKLMGVAPGKYRQQFFARKN